MSLAIHFAFVAAIVLLSMFVDLSGLGTFLHGLQFWCYVIIGCLSLAQIVLLVRARGDRTMIVAHALMSAGAFAMSGSVVIAAATWKYALMFASMLFWLPSFIVMMTVLRTKRAAL